MLYTSIVSTGRRFGPCPCTTANASSAAPSFRLIFASVTLMKSHLAAESKGTCRKATITVSAVELKHPRQSLAACEAEAERQQQQQGAASFSSSVFCRGGDKNNSRRSHPPGGSAAPVGVAGDDRNKTATCVLLGGRGGGGGGGGGNKITDPVGLLDVKQRLRMTPSALWGDRADLADEAEQHQQHQQHQAMAGGEMERSAAAALKSPTAALYRPPQKGSDPLGEARRVERNRDRASRQPPPAGGKKEETSVRCVLADKRTAVDAVGCGGRTSATGLAASALSRGDGAETESPLPVGETLAQAASLKRSVVTSSIPLRWQSRVVTLSSLQNHGGASGGAPRHASSAAASGRRRVRTKPRLNQRSTKKRYFEGYDQDWYFVFHTRRPSLSTLKTKKVTRPCVTFFF